MSFFQGKAIMRLSVVASLALLFFVQLSDAQTQGVGKYIADDLGDKLEQYNRALEKHGAVAITVCNKFRGHYCGLLRSARMHGVMLHVINYGAKTHVNTNKVILMNEILSKFSPETIVLFVDCYDVVFNVPFTQLIQRFKDTKSQIIFPVEHVCYPDDVHLEIDGKRTKMPTCIDAYTHLNVTNTCITKTPPLYVNSGAYIGYAGQLKKMMSDAKDSLLKFKRFGRDQKLFHEAFLSKKYGIEADFCIQHILTLHALDVYCGWSCAKRSHKDYVVTFETSNTTPSILHFNGLSKGAWFNKLIANHPFHYDKAIDAEDWFWVNNTPEKVETYCNMTTRN